MEYEKKFEDGFWMCFYCDDAEDAAKAVRRFKGLLGRMPVEYYATSVHIVNYFLQSTIPVSDGAPTITDGYHWLFLR